MAPGRRPSDWKMDALEQQAKQRQREYERKTEGPKMEFRKANSLTPDEEVTLVQIFHIMELRERDNGRGLAPPTPTTFRASEFAAKGHKEWMQNLCEKARRAGLLEYVGEDEEKYQFPPDKDFFHWFARLNWFGSEIEQSSVYWYRRDWKTVDD